MKFKFTLLLSLIASHFFAQDLAISIFEHEITKDKAENSSFNWDKHIYHAQLISKSELEFCGKCENLAYSTRDSDKGIKKQKSNQFELTSDTQTVTFFIGQGWVGGGASMPILNLDNYRPKKMNGLDLYFDENYKDIIRNKMPNCIKGRPEIKITATIYLEEKNVGVTSNPPSTRKIYEAVVVDLIDIQVKTKLCDD